MTEHEAAQKVIDKVLGLTQKPHLIAVFVGKNKQAIQMTRPSSGVFEQAIKVRLHDFCGVYNAQATAQMIIDDLRYAGFEQ